MWVVFFFAVSGSGPCAGSLRTSVEGAGRTRPGSHRLSSLSAHLITDTSHTLELKTTTPVKPYTQQYRVINNTITDKV